MVGTSIEPVALAGGHLGRRRHPRAGAGAHASSACRCRGGQGRLGVRGSWGEVLGWPRCCFATLHVTPATWRRRGGCAIAVSAKIARKSRGRCTFSFAPCPVLDATVSGRSWLKSVNPSGDLHEKNSAQETHTKIRNSFSFAQGSAFTCGRGDSAFRHRGGWKWGKRGS